MSLGSPFDGPRDFTYIKPSGRRITEYEAYNLFVQPTDPNVSEPTAKPTGWSSESTELKASNWYSFRDPAAMWQRPYNRRQAEQARTIERVMSSAVRSGSIRRIDKGWADEVLGDFYVPCAYFERGLCRALGHASLVALSDVLSVALLYNSVDKERHAEDILFHQYDLLHAGVPIGQSDRKDEWLSDNQLQPMRRLVEDINATRDWCEVLMSVNLVVEPLLGRLIYSEMLASSATRHGDHVTGVILAEAESDRQRNIEWTCALADMLLSDPQHGDRNRELINSFLGYWVAEVRVVMGTLSQVAERAGIDLDAATGRVTHDWKVLVEQCRLDVSQWDGSQTQAIATLS